MQQLAGISVYVNDTRHMFKGNVLNLIMTLSLYSEDHLRWAWKVGHTDEMDIMILFFDDDQQCSHHFNY